VGVSVPDIAVDYQPWLWKSYEEYTELLTLPFDVPAGEAYVIPESVAKYAKGASVSGELHVFGKLEVV
jgi:hypothetical protein